MAFAIFLPMLPISATASQRQPTLLAELEEESIPAQDLPASSPAESPSPNAAPSPDADTNPNSGEWIAAPAGEPTTAEGQAPIPNPSPSSQPSAAAPAEIAPAIDVGSIATTPQISDSSLAPLIDTAPTPARAASLRITEQQRVELEQGHTDDAIRELAHAISIDPSNSYAYFYLGRAYVARKDYTQAQTFFKRAEIGLASNSAWLGEIYAFEGLSLEESGKSAEAAAAYQKALAASPGNLTARVGVMRVSGSVPADDSAAAPPPDLDQAAPEETDPPDAPDEDPAPPP
ncbi:tetratricopeptide repeat protein, partial [Candidatus Binatus sp.]|uniref:tetratricopeptide repeat protein n=1 Tax=Candidatus Binatus sp. TaxID=2811406 RepID=UPI003C62A413